MNNIPEDEFAQTDVERRIRTLREVISEAVASDDAEDGLNAIFTDAQRRRSPRPWPSFAVRPGGVSTPSLSRGVMSEVATLLPRQRIMIACDIEEATTRTNPARAALRADMYDLFEAALLECQITEDLRETFVDSGDGAMALVRPVDGVSVTMLLRTFVPALSEMLAEHAAIHQDRMFQLRVAIHSGEVHFDRRGIFGEDVDITFRLLNAQMLKQRLRQTDGPLALVVSDHIHQSVIRHGYAGIDSRTFEPIIVLEVAGQRHTGWVHVPGVDSQYGKHDKNSHADWAG